MYAVAPGVFNSSAVPCDCLAHVYGNAADDPEREPRHPSDMSDAEWTVVRPLLPTPVWLEGREGQPEGYCHRQMLDAIRYLVAARSTATSPAREAADDGHLAPVVARTTGGMAVPHAPVCPR